MNQQDVRQAISNWSIKLPSSLTAVTSGNFRLLGLKSIDARHASV